MRQPSSDTSITLALLLVTLVFGLILALTTYLSYLSGLTRQGTGDYSYAKTETAREIIRRELPTPVRPPSTDKEISLPS
jgi:hypothetical protein